MAATAIGFFESVWERAETLAELGLSEAARPLLSQLASSSRAPRHLRAAALRVLGRLEFEAAHYARARRYLHAALALEPQDAYTAFLIGLTYEWQEQPALSRAYHYYRTAASYDESEPLYRAACHCIRAELFTSKAVQRDALRELDRCFTEDPDSPEVAFYYLRGLRAAGKEDAARWLHALCQRRWPTMPEFSQPLDEPTAKKDEARAVMTVGAPSGKKGKKARQTRPRILRFPSAQSNQSRRIAR